MSEFAKPNLEMTQMAHSMMPFTKSLGLEVCEGSSGRVVARAGWTKERCTSDELLHGGYLMAVADSVGAACAWLNLPKDAKTATIESKTNFFKGVTEGHIKLIATPVHVGRTTIVVQTDITSERDDLVSRTIQTQAVITKS
jgi:1,4-dihydroxy-2-naphthoyl-CoA hydrolase